MSSKFRVSIEARSDIKNIGRYTQKAHGTDQRSRYLSGLNQKFEFLAGSPEIHRERTEFDPPVRISHYEEHMIVYIIDDHGILIVRVLHSRMDIKQKLSGETD